mmetsp:Transcript_34841/g.52625  ORF Transcript_34841/g.52625 Transcript_34841/m.52625 type:complete len:244 (+) Transcript_34841:315-1046(+)
MQHYGFSGYDSDAISFDWSYIKNARDAYIRRLNAIYQRNMDNSNVTTMFGSASFFNSTENDDGFIKVAVDHDTTTKYYKAKHVLIATGGYPELLSNGDGEDDDDDDEIEKNKMKTGDFCIKDYFSDDDDDNSSSSEGSNRNEEIEKENMENVMIAMENELQGTNVKYESNKNNQDTDVNSLVINNHQDDNDDIRKDIQILSNLMESLDAQEGGAGPVSNILGEMGILPLRFSMHDDDCDNEEK